MVAAGCICSAQPGRQRVLWARSGGGFLRLAALRAVFPGGTLRPLRLCPEALLLELGAEMAEREGSRVEVFLFGLVRVFHCPHPSPDTDMDKDKGAVAAMRKWLEENGVKP